MTGVSRYTSSSGSTLSSNSSPNPSQLSIVASFNKDSSELVLARMVAVDLISIYKLLKSIDIQRGWAAQGLKIPSSRQAIT